MTDEHEATTMNAGPETKATSKAVAVLCAQYLQRVQAEGEALAALALESDGMDPQDGWRLDIQRATFVKAS
jgi:hypothetical protein